MITKEQEEQAFQELLAYDQEQMQKRIDSLEIVKKNVSHNMYEDIIHYIVECYHTEQFEITKEVPNDEHKQKEHYDYLTEVWVNQYCNGGYVGDDYAGWIWIKINAIEYLKFHYSM